MKWHWDHRQFYNAPKSPGLQQEGRRGRATAADTAFLPLGLAVVGRRAVLLWQNGRVAHCPESAACCLHNRHHLVGRGTPQGECNLSNNESIRFTCLIFFFLFPCSKNKFPSENCTGIAENVICCIALQFGTLFFWCLQKFGGISLVMLFGEFLIYIFHVFPMFIHTTWEVWGFLRVGGCYFNGKFRFKVFWMDDFIGAKLCKTYTGTTHSHTHANTYCHREK